MDHISVLAEAEHFSMTYKIDIGMKSWQIWSWVGSAKASTISSSILARRPGKVANPKIGEIGHRLTGSLVKNYSIDNIQEECYFHLTLWFHAHCAQMQRINQNLRTISEVASSIYLLIMTSLVWTLEPWSEFEAV